MIIIAILSQVLRYIYIYIYQMHGADPETVREGETRETDRDTCRERNIQITTQQLYCPHGATHLAALSKTQQNLK